MLSQCSKCSLSKSTGPMSSVLPQCQCDWKMPTAQPQQETDAWHEIVLNQKQFLDKMELLLAKTTAPPQPEQEPVAEIVSNVNGSLSTQWSEKWLPNPGDKLYTAPPQRTWVGLTDEDVHDCLKGLPTQSIKVYARSIEAKLKQKNGYAEEKNT